MVGERGSHSEQAASSLQRQRRLEVGAAGQTAHSASEIFHCLRALVAWYFKALDCFRRLLAIYCYHSKILPSSITYGGMV
jgi:hypothetical protein